MKKLLLLFLLAVAAVFFVSYLRNLGDVRGLSGETPVPKEETLKIALVADSHNDNLNLAKALEIAKARNVKFVIGLGDYTDIGTVDQLTQAKRVFDASGLQYYVTAGDHDLWDSRNEGNAALTNFTNVFGKSSYRVDIQNALFVILDDSDIYSGITIADWNLLNEAVQTKPRLTFIFAHKTPYHPDSAHIMGQDNQKVAGQAKQLLGLIEGTRTCHSEFISESDRKILNQVQDDKHCSKVDGFFSGDLHFFAEFPSPSGSVKITTVGALDTERNFQGPRFAILKVYDDYSWEVEDVEVK